MEKEQIDRFANLFRGNQRTHGVFVPRDEVGRKDKKSFTSFEPIRYEDFENHLTGKQGIGIVPIMDDGHCWFGAIDIDAHGDAPDIDIVELERRVRADDLPLTVCRSKSGGAHLYLFGAEPLKASIVRPILAKWAAKLGHAGVEIFPKQSQLIKDSDGEMQNGNWLNLAWFHAEHENCLRYAVEGGKRVSFSHFLDIAESRRISPSMLIEKGEDEHREAPPCIQQMIANGVPDGKRNEAMYNMVIYLKKAFPETYRDRAFDLNARIFDTPLSHSEAKKTIASAGRRDYRYKCGEEPCKSLCRSFECVNRKFGITVDEKSEMDMGSPPEFGPLEKYMTTPVRWVLHVDGAKLNLTTPQLMDFRAIREAVADNLTRLIPPMKNDRWQIQLHKLMETAMLIEAPEDATIEGMLWNRLCEFVSRADLDSDGTDIDDRQSILYGTPVVQVYNGERVVYFRGSDFTAYLKKQRVDDVRGPSIWVMLRDHGCDHTKLKINKSAVNVWYVPLSKITGIEEIPAKNPKAEF
ncbi:hypothetical protein [Providencia phage Kokobel2]|nr:hypothetical protein [Providencia phage Kokobel2]